MTVSACAQKTSRVCRAACDPIFTPEFFAPYQQAIETAFWLLCDAREHMRGPFEVCAMTSRLKSPSSIRGKLIKKGLPITEAAAHAALRDIAGLRVVLASTQSVYDFAALLRRSSIAQIEEEQDYIASPKASGYRSLHLILRVPVSLKNRLFLLPAEIQLRTAGMDVWANIEHELIYKPVKTQQNAPV